MGGLYRSGYAGAVQPSTTNQISSVDQQILEHKPLGPRSVGLHELTAAVIPPGVMWQYGGAAAPVGWLLCDGSAVSRTVYASLYAALGTAYGVGDGTTTFNVPDLRNRLPMGTGNGGPALGVVGGTPATAASDPNSAHTHSFAGGVFTPNSGINHTHTGVTTGGGTSSGMSVDHNHDLSGMTTGGASISANHTHAQQGLGVNFIIKT